MSQSRIPNEQGELGRYDEITERMLKEVQASCVAALIVGGKHGSGFSVAITDRNLLAQLPDMLEHMAKKHPRAAGGGRQ
jgi:hypothetical protein